MNPVEEMKKKYDEQRGVVITYDKKGRAYISFNVGGVPLKQFEEWNEMCESEFNSSRWQKIFLDHRMHLNFLAMTQGVSEVVPKEVPSEKEPEKKIALIGGGEL